MRKFWAIVSGLYLALWAALALVSVIFTVFFGDQASLMSAPAQRFVSLGFGLFFAAALLTVGIGTLRLKAWARIALLVLSALVLVAGGIGVLGMLGVWLFMRSRMELGAAHVAVAAVYALLMVGVPLFFVIFFTRPRVKELFSGQPHPAGARPLGISLIAALAAVSALGLLWTLLVVPAQVFPLFGGTLRLSGVWMKLYCAVFAAASAHIAFALFRLRKSGWAAAMAYFSFSLLQNSFFLFSLNPQYLREATPGVLTGTEVDRYLVMLRVGTLIGVLFHIFLVWYLWRRKPVFRSR